MKGLRVISVVLIQIKLAVCWMTAWDFLIGADMTQSAVLDDEGILRVRWLIDRENDAVDFVIFAKCAGWVGLSISSAPLGTPGAYGDIILAGYDDHTGQGYIEDRWIDLSEFHIKPGGDLDKQSDVTLLGAWYYHPWTIVRFRRSIDTGDSQDIPLEAGIINLEYAFSDSDNTSHPHLLEHKGVKKVVLIPDKNL